MVWYYNGMKNNSQKQFWIELLRVALPISVQYLISQVLMMIDNIMIGSLHEANITAVTILSLIHI